MISDIDECAGEAHNCSSNAVCNNTKGSYNCTCKPGYEGDGNNCKGNYYKNKKMPEGAYAGCVGVKKNYRYVVWQWKVE